MLAWCQFVPDAFKDVACRGSGTGCSCKAFCARSVPATWRWNPECCSCKDSGEAPVQGGSASSVPSWCRDIPAVQRVAIPACTSSGLRDPSEVDSNSPSWCSSIPVAVRINVLPCSEARQCSCSESCSLTPSTSWRYSPTCCGCSGASEPPAEGSGVPSSSPTWCSDIPVSMQDYAPACSGTGSCSCADTCGMTPQSFWRYSPLCCGCSGATSSAPANISGSTAPAWCASVPAAQRINALPCADMGQCQCSSFCSVSPATSWGYNPLCCGCSGAQVPSLPTTPSDSSSVPSWCSSVPESQQSLVAACTSQGGCQCLDDCKAAPAFTWRFNPTCCGCAASSESAPTSGALVPTPPALGCSCSSLCSMAPSSLWRYNPLCCGCSGSGQ